MTIRRWPFPRFQNGKKEVFLSLSRYFLLWKNAVGVRIRVTEWEKRHVSIIGPTRNDPGGMSGFYTLFSSSFLQRFLVPAIRGKRKNEITYQKSANKRDWKRWTGDTENKILKTDNSSNFQTFSLKACKDISKISSDRVSFVDHLRALCLHRMFEEASYSFF